MVGLSWPPLAPPIGQPYKNLVALPVGLGPPLDRGGARPTTGGPSSHLVTGQVGLIVGPPLVQSRGAPE